MRTDLLKLWKLKSRIHAFVLILGSLAAVPYVVEHNLVWAATWRLLVVLLVLMSCSADGRPPIKYKMGVRGRPQ